MRFAGFLEFFIIVCLLLSSLCSASYVFRSGFPEMDTDLPKLEGRIVNGTKAHMGQFPHQVSLRRSYSSDHFCGGSIIAEDWILTAAHCMFKNSGAKISPWSITVTAGHVRLDQTDASVQKHSVTVIIVHKDFDKATLTNDIALLKVKAPFNLNTPYATAAKLETRMPEPGSNCQVSGWGYLAENKTVVSNDLMFVDLPLIHPQRCKELLIGVTKLPLGMFCAGYEEGLRDACQGDSGGGMICGDTLTGIVSGGEGCARPALPGLYADVPYYHNWITYQIRSFNESNLEPTTTEFNIGKAGTDGSHTASSSLSFGALFATFSLLSFFGRTMGDRV